jgi:hypothetical protein
MKKIRLDLGGPNGNAVFIMTKVQKLCRMEGRENPAEEAKDICARMRGDVFTALGGSGNDYEGLLRVFKDEFPYVELYATYDIGIAKDLYTLDDDPDIIEL